MKSGSHRATRRRSGSARGFAATLTAARVLAAALVSTSLAVACSAQPATPAGPTPTPQVSKYVPTAAPSQVSADQQLVAVRGSDLWLVPFTGAARQLTSFAPTDLVADPIWSPDGRLVAFSRLSLTTGQRELPGSDLELLDVESGAVSSLVQHDQPGAQLVSPTWLTEDVLLYAYYAPIYQNNVPTGAIRELRRLDRQTGQVRTVMTGTIAVGVSADRQTLAYLTAAGNSTGDLVVAPVAGGEPRVLVKAGTFTDVAVPRPSPDGSQIVFAAVGRPPGADFPPSPLPSRSTARPAWPLAWLSPGVALAHGIPWDVWIVNRDGSGLKPLTNLNEDTPTPSWSPDGEQVAFQAENATYLLDVAERRVVLLSASGGYGGSDWRPAPGG